MERSIPRLRVHGRPALRGIFDSVQCNFTFRKFKVKGGPFEKVFILAILTTGTVKAENYIILYAIEHYVRGEPHPIRIDYIDMDFQTFFWHNRDVCCNVIAMLFDL